MTLNTCTVRKHRRQALPHYQSPATWYHVTMSLARDVVLTREECRVIFDACRFYEGKLWNIAALAVLPEAGTHVLCFPLPPGNPYPLEAIVQREKGFSGHRINQLRGTHGALWCREYFDRTIRSAKDFSTVIAYIRTNPVKHGVVTQAKDWPWLFVHEDCAVDEHAGWLGVLP